MSEINSMLLSVSNETPEGQRDKVAGKVKRRATPAQLKALEKARAARWPKGKQDIEDGAATILDVLTKGDDIMPAAKTNAKEKIYQLLPKVTEEIGAIRKGQQNSHQRYKYRGIDDALNQVSPVLARFGICTEVSVTNHHVERKDGGKTVYHATLQLQVAFIAPDGSRVTSQAPGEGISHGDDKATAKAMSAAMKYALFFGLMIPVDTDELEDSDRHGQAEPEVQPAVLQAQTMMQQTQDVPSLKKLAERIKKSDVFDRSEKAALMEQVKTRTAELELEADE